MVRIGLPVLRRPAVRRSAVRSARPTSADPGSGERFTGLLCSAGNLGVFAGKRRFFQPGHDHFESSPDMMRTAIGSPAVGRACRGPCPSWCPKLSDALADTQAAAVDGHLDAAARRRDRAASDACSGCGSPSFMRGEAAARTLDRIVGIAGPAAIISSAPSSAA